MKRNNCNNYDRNRPVFNHIRNNISKINPVGTEILVNQLWMQDEDTGVKIIELNSSSEESEFVNNVSHAWSFVNNGRFEDENYKVNEDARNRRRMNLNENNLTTAYANRCNYDGDVQTNSNAFYSTYDADINTSVNHQMNCFTIINNQNIHSDSSTEAENEAYEIIELDSAEEKKWDHLYNEEVITYDPITQTEKRTVWIYSYKNKRLLSENDFELVNIPSKDTSCSSTSSDEDLNADKCTNACRLGSPIPATYIPRLDLSLVQTLSTVTEVSEPNKSQSKNSLHEKIHLKPRNNWLTERHDKIRHKENSNVVNWLALSPRERRRRSINSDVTSKENVNESESTHAEGIEQLHQVSINKSGNVLSETVQVQVDIHTNGKESCREIFVNNSSNIKSDTVEIKKISNILPMNISFADADNDTDNNNNLEIDYSSKPYIQLDSKVNKTKITDPIEKLNCSNWIAEDKVEKETALYDYDVDTAAQVNVKDYGSDHDCDSVSRRLWKKNMQLMKPAQWAEYLPITCSPTSLHLSLSLESINRKKSWCTRLAKLIKCCK